MAEDNAQEWAAEWERMVDQVACRYDTSRQFGALALATDLVRPMTCEALRWFVAKHLTATAREESRRRALAVERDAFKLDRGAQPHVGLSDADGESVSRPVLAAVGALGAAATPPRGKTTAAARNLYEGRYRHGSMARRDGAAIRDCPCTACETARITNSKGLYGLIEKIGQAVDEYATQLRMEWTAEMLATPFSLPNGDRVTWGSASVAQHQLRVEMFQGQATTAVEGGARHLLAIKEIRTAGVACLDEAVAISA